MNPVKPPPIAAYYGWLARAQDALAAAGLPGRRGHAVHRRLAGADGTVSDHVLDERLLEAVAWPAASPAPTVLDAGCGLGGTSFFLHERLRGPTVGVTLSPAQCARAVREAERRGVGGACRFAVRSYDGDLRDLLPGGADLVVAIESLAHASDPAATIARWAAILRSGGRLAVVDDMPLDSLARGDADFADFRAGWLAPAPAAAAAIREAMTAAGLRIVADVDLTPAMPRRSPAALARRLAATRLARAAIGWTPAGVLLAAWHGGLALERLYARGLMRYGVIVAERSVTPTPAPA